MQRSLTTAALADIAGHIAEGNTRFRQLYPGDTTGRRPIHTVYGGAQLFKAGSAARLGALALTSLDDHAPDFASFARALGLPGAADLPDDPAGVAAVEAAFAEDEDAARDARPAAWLPWAVYTRVREKLRREPVEDMRVDFEDGYGSRSDAEEDGHAAVVAQQLAAGMAAGGLPPFVGIRIKSFAPECFERAARTLDITLTSLAAHTGGRLPANFVVTLPKVTIPEHVAALADLLDLLETDNRIAPGAVAIDLMIETPQAIVNARGENGIGQLVRAGRGRVVSAAFGVYDYTASCNITARYQTYIHPAADFARHAMQAGLAGSGVSMSDSVTTVLPIGPQRPAASGQPLTAEQQAENRATVHDAWRLHYDNIRHSLRSGFYQGWDLHPAQLPVRYAAVYAFFLESLPDAARRLNAFVERAAQATLVGNTFDDAATGQGLLNFFLRGLACGALDEAEVAAAGITLEELRERSFAKIAANRADGRRPTTDDQR
jgi:citrate lyase beta subunit